MLSLLPNGVLDDDLHQMTPADIDTQKGSSILQQTALAFRDVQGCLKCLSPICEYIQLYRPCGLKILLPLVTFYEKLAKHAQEASYTAERPLLLRVVLPQIGNLQSVIMITM